jgi:hypothetical protein
MTGNDGDYYLNVVTGDVFQKLSGTWNKIGNIKGPPFTPSTSKVRVYNATLPQTFIASVAAVKVYFPSKEFDTLNEFNTSLYRFTAQNYGYYLITANIGSTSTSATNVFNIFIYKNGVQHTTTFQNTKNPHPNITDIIYLNVGDYIELWGSGGSNHNPVILGQDKLWMSIFKII